MRFRGVSFAILPEESNPFSTSYSHITQRLQWNLLSASLRQPEWVENTPTTSTSAISQSSMS
jgi:hypothetical protein